MIQSKVTVALQELAHGHDHLTPDLAVTAARDPRSPLYQYFEWNDAEAARKLITTSGTLPIAPVRAY